MTLQIHAPVFRRYRRFVAGAALLLAFDVGAFSAQIDSGTFKPAIDENAGITLFSFDSVSIPFTSSLELKMQTPEKYSGNPVVARGAKGEPDHWGVQFYGSIVREGDTFRMWYAAFAGERGESLVPNSAWWQPAYAESKDGIRWTKPKLNLVEYRGSKENNILLFEPFMGTLNVKVLHEPEDPDPSRRYKMITHTFWMKGKTRHGTIVPYVSADGYRWKSLIKTVPVDAELPVKDLLIPPMHFEPAGGFYKWDGMYYSSGQSPYDVTQPLHSRIARGIRSRDLATWSQTAHLNFARSEQHVIKPVGNDGKQTHEGISVWNRGNVLLGLYGMWEGGKTWPEVTIDMGFVISNDGVSFREPAHEKVFIKCGPDGAWDQGGLMQGQGLENVGDKTYIYYGAADPRSWTSADKPIPPRGGVGLVTLPRDRFGDLRVRDYGEGVSELITKDLTAKSGSSWQLYVNADGLGQESNLRLELLAHDESPLPVYSGKNAAVVSQSGFQTPVNWKGQRALSGLPERFRIKATFEGAKKDAIRFYAFYVQDAK